MHTIDPNLSPGKIISKILDSKEFVEESKLLKIKSDSVIASVNLDRLAASSDIVSNQI